MFRDSNFHHGNRAERLVRRGHPVFWDVISDYFVINNSGSKKMTLLKALLNGMGVTGTSLLLYFNVGGWKANILWVLMGLFWAVQFLRACLKLYFEYKDGQIEMKAKARRYEQENSSL